VSAPRHPDFGFRLGLQSASVNLFNITPITSGLPFLIVCEETIMVWTTPTLVEICIGLEINGYLPAEF
jgi:coenzyme PQQ precursor peptide PqqA